MNFHPTLHTVDRCNFARNYQFARYLITGYLLIGGFASHNRPAESEVLSGSLLAAGFFYQLAYALGGLGAVTRDERGEHPQHSADQGQHHDAPEDGHDRSGER